MTLSDMWNKLGSRQSLPHWVVAALLLVLLLLMYGGWYPHPNEEVYLSLAMEKAGAFEADELISEGLQYGESAVFNFLVGHLLMLTGLETGRLLLLLLIGALLAHNLVRIVNLAERQEGKRANPDILLSAAVFILLGQAIVGEEWLFLGAEPKSFAYVCVFFSIRYLLARRFFPAAIIGSAAALFHVLVGGWWMLAFGLLILVNREAGSWPRRIGIIFSGAVIPLAVVGYMLWEHPELLSGGGNALANEIYVQIRNPHHLTLFWPIGTFIYDRFASFMFYVLSIVAGFALGRRAFRSMHGGSREYGYLMLVLSALLTVTLVLSAVDVNFMFSKYYLFRLASLHLLLSVIGAVHAVKGHFGPRALLPAGYALVLLVLLGGLLRNAAEQRYCHEENEKYAPMIKHIREQTSLQAKFFVLTGEDIDTPRSFSRKSGRKRYVLNKMIPATSADVLHWYDRIQLKQRIMDGETELLDTLDDVDYILADRRLPGRSPIYSVNGLHLYKN